MTILEIKKLKKDFKGLRALNNVDLDVHLGEIFGIIGPNGSGKTTLFNIVTGFLNPTEGQVIYKGKSIVGLKPHQIAEAGIGRVFQLSSLFPNLSVNQNLIGSRHLRTNNNFLGSFFNTASYQHEELKLEKKVAELLAFVGLEERQDVVAKNLPYGEQRKLELAMALAAEPELLLLDEPATGMNPEETEKIMHLIQSIQQAGVTILVVEHNMKLIMGICTRISVINFGAKIVEGTPEEIALNEDVVSIYLGKRKGSA